MSYLMAEYIERLENDGIQKDHAGTASGALCYWSLKGRGPREGQNWLVSILPLVPCFMSLISHLTASLWKQYIKHAKALQQTGGGISQDSDNEGSADEGTNIVMDFKSA